MAEKDPIARDNDTPGLTYFGAHAQRNLGPIEWQTHFSSPLSRAYFNPRTKTSTYTVYNPNAQLQSVTVFQSGAPIGTLQAAPNSMTVVQKLQPIATPKAATKTKPAPR